MLDIQKKTLQKAIDLLDTLGCSYAIIDLDGNSYGTLQVNEPSLRKKSKSIFPYGEVAAYLTPYLSKMQKGDVVCVPIGKYNPQSLQGSVASWYFKRFGAAAQTSTINRTKNCIEVMRLK